MQAGYQILAVSVDRPSKLQESAEKYEMNYLLLSDSSAAAVKAFGLAYKVNDDVFGMLKGYNMDLEETSGQKHHILPVPAVFIIGTDGKIKFEYANPDYKVRIKADVLVAAAKAYLTDN